MSSFTTSITLISFYCHFFILVDGRGRKLNLRHFPDTGKKNVTRTCASWSFYFRFDIDDDDHDDIGYPCFRRERPPYDANILDKFLHQLKGSSAR